MRRVELRNSDAEQERLDFNAILDELAGNMIVYDQLQAQRQPMEESRCLLLQDFEAIDLDIPAELQPEQLARKALEAVIIDKKLEELSARDTELTNHNNEAHIITLLKGKKVKLTSTDPDKYKIGTLHKNEYGQYDGMSQWHETKEGYVHYIALDPEYGGYIELENRSGSKLYTTQFLIDRNNNYLPAFKLEIF
jgi:hypothetical protein